APERIVMVRDQNAIEDDRRIGEPVVAAEEERSWACLVQTIAINPGVDLQIHGAGPVGDVKCTVAGEKQSALVDRAINKRGGGGRIGHDIARQTQNAAHSKVDVAAIERELVNDFGETVDRKQAVGLNGDAGSGRKLQIVHPSGLV